MLGQQVGHGSNLALAEGLAHYMQSEPKSHLNQCSLAENAGGTSQPTRRANVLHTNALAAMAAVEGNALRGTSLDTLAEHLTTGLTEVTKGLLLQRVAEVRCMRTVELQAMVADVVGLRTENLPECCETLLRRACNLVSGQVGREGLNFAQQSALHEISTAVSRSKHRGCPQQGYS
jgi:hypothetical protein